MKRLPVILAIVTAGVLAGTSTFADDRGDTSGPAAGKPINPSTVVQKQNTHVDDNNTTVTGPSGTSAGAPGVEGGRGTQSGREWTPPAEIRRR